MNDELKFCASAHDVTPMELTGFMQLAESTYTDSTGSTQAPPTPEGFTKADHICWNASIYHVLLLLDGLNPASRYNVLIKEVPA